MHRDVAESNHSHIEVILNDGAHYYLKPKELDVMLNNDLVMRFKRSTGWVTVGVHPIRAKTRSDLCPLYYGHDRRRQTASL